MTPIPKINLTENQKIAGCLLIAFFTGIVIGKAMANTKTVVLIKPQAKETSVQKVIATKRTNKAKTKAVKK